MLKTKKYTLILLMFLLYYGHQHVSATYVTIFEVYLLIFKNFMHLINSRNMEHIKHTFYVLILTFQTLHFTKKITLSFKVSSCRIFHTAN